MRSCPAWAGGENIVLHLPSYFKNNPKDFLRCFALCQDFLRCFTHCQDFSWCFTLCQDFSLCLALSQDSKKHLISFLSYVWRSVAAKICQWMHLYWRFEQPPLIMISALISWNLRQMCLCCMPRGINSNSNLKLSILLSLVRQSSTTINTKVSWANSSTWSSYQGKKTRLVRTIHANQISQFCQMRSFSFPTKSCQNEFLFLC